MEFLNREKERALRVVSRFESVNANRRLIEARCPDKHVLVELMHAGYVSIHSSVREDGDSDLLQISLTSDGRCYFSDKRRDRFRRWAPVLASAAIGAAGSLLGVALALLLA